MFNATWTWFTLIALTASVAFGVRDGAAEVEPRRDLRDVQYRYPGSPEEPDPTRLRALLRQLVDYVLEHHTEKDPQDPQFGMVYEFYDPQSKKWLQDPGLDTMHDGAWSVNALVLDYLATGTGITSTWRASTRWPSFRSRPTSSMARSSPTVRSGNTSSGCAVSSSVG